MAKKKKTVSKSKVKVKSKVKAKPDIKTKMDSACKDFKKRSFGSRFGILLIAAYCFIFIILETSGYVNDYSSNIFRALMFGIVGVVAIELATECRGLKVVKSKLIQ